MARNDGLAELAALSAKVKGERQRLLDGLRAFEKKLVVSSDGLGWCGSSQYVTLEQWTYEQRDDNSVLIGWLFFDGTKLTVRTEDHMSGWDDPICRDYEIDEANLEWLLMLSTPEKLESLVASMLRGLEEERITFSTANERLTEFVSAEKAAIDSDIQEQFQHQPTLLESWQKAQKAVEVDPEDSIARSCSHAETAMKTCLKQLGDTGYETLPVHTLTSQVVKKLREAGTLDEGALKSLNGIGPIFHGVGTLRNSSSTAHGKNDGYTPPGPDVAQLINHLAGACSAFLLKQTEKVLKEKE
ncbi:abortive infection family protein [Pseudomonas sp. H9]|uniref:abortive infection family protein n=1 Tax=Pseudomonas sp. H9 TaxID=483968 RepID=UPI001057FA63|nr:abortive infection family protein [Pseudomonas sp. H9]TDF82001.1 hypothetical protein E1573_15430 [Pseudomonas sp. H9]